MQTHFDANETLTLSAIATLLGRDIKTIKTWLSKGRWTNAKQDPDGLRTWRVPVSDLVAASDIDPSQITQVENMLAASRESRETKVLREQVIRFEERLVAAQALADERADTIALLKGLVRKAGAA